MIRSGLFLVVLALSAGFPSGIAAHNRTIEVPAGPGKRWDVSLVKRQRTLGAGSACTTSDQCAGNLACVYGACDCVGSHVCSYTDYDCCVSVVTSSPPPASAGSSAALWIGVAVTLLIVCALVFGVRWWMRKRGIRIIGPTPYPEEKPGSPMSFDSRYSFDSRMLYSPPPTRAGSRVRLTVATPPPQLPYLHLQQPLQLHFPLNRSSSPFQRAGSPRTNSPLTNSPLLRPATSSSRPSSPRANSPLAYPQSAAQADYSQRFGSPLRQYMSG
ncbi:hypothetical protein M427DRAFT_64329 [Gonapodya prolifera JEL478]|uniref:SMB domain-containing protein n=1 Tax=Gonapodya prolifera (strain JEL478) TaxID=1344416 RepID=A0A138ZXQ1_GONPJ|nr:hypothetical protein M427DRAFT_64329 [Gonapodya prolifera JEL478]|eukprot:KXS09290.1 hypothetical protein M427DRAFT_64329 [Gonapodya prolifera JEL478]